MATRILHFDHPVGDWPSAVAATPAEIMRLDGRGRARRRRRRPISSSSRAAAGPNCCRGPNRIASWSATARAIERDAAGLCRTRRPDGCMTMDIAALRARSRRPQDRGQPSASSSRRAATSTGTRPVLKRQLDHVTGDLVVSPQSEAEVIRVLAACHRHGVPVTPRGTGTGNYGQAMPLSGGVVLDLAEHERGHGDRDRAASSPSPGAIMADIDKATRAAFRRRNCGCTPRPTHTASIGGFIAGGSGGVGSIRWGGLRDFGNVIRLRVVTMEAEPRVLELTGEDLHKVTHAYGTNGIITEVEMPLTAAYDWVDVIVGFDELHGRGALRQCARPSQDGLLLKLITPSSRRRCRTTISSATRSSCREGQSICVVMVAPHSLRRVPRLHAARTAARSSTRRRLLRTRRRRACRRPSSLPGTTRRCARCASIPSITYLQIALSRSRTSSSWSTRSTRLFRRRGVRRISNSSASTARSPASACRWCASPPRSGSTRSCASTRTMGCPIFNPHRYTLEEGGMKQTDEVQLAFKREADPQGLLNPGKMIAWEDPDYDFRSRQDLPVQGAGAGLRDGKLMKVLVLYAHPVETSFNAALHRLIVERLTARRPRGRRLRPLRRGLRPAPDAARSGSPITTRAGQHDAGRAPMSSGCRAPRRWCSAFRSGTTAIRPS